MPKMGESIMEATILKWSKQVGDTVTEDETILEIATDKVDSEIPSPVDGVVTQILHQVDEVVEVGKVIAIIETDAAEASKPADPPVAEAAPVESQPSAPKAQPTPAPTPTPTPKVAVPVSSSKNGTTRFYSPLVKSIAKQEGIDAAELETIPGSGSKGRVNKKDILNYIAQRGSAPKTSAMPAAVTTTAAVSAAAATAAPAAPRVASASGGDEIIQMDRMRKLIANHMVMSKKTSPHVTSFVEADVTNMVNWRNKNKAAFQAKYGEKITFTPLIMEAVIKAIKDFPMINVTIIDDDKIKVLKDINIGMAAALPTGNLIVPVIKNADYLNLAGLTKSINDLASRARANKLKPEEIQGGTFTLTNVGTFGNVMGTPIINQPQVATYDHRVVDGFLGGSFVRKVADYLENFDINRDI